MLAFRSSWLGGKQSLTLSFVPAVPALPAVQIVDWLYEVMSKLRLPMGKQVGCSCCTYVASRGCV